MRCERHFFLFFFFLLIADHVLLKTSVGDSTHKHKQHVRKAVYIQVSSIHLLTTQTAQTIACSLVLSQVDYCNSPLSEDPYTKRFKRMLILFQIFFFSTFRLPYAGPPVSVEPVRLRRSATLDSSSFNQRL